MTSTSAVIRLATKLTSRVVCVRSPSAGPFSRSSANTYLLGTGSKRWLIDTGTAHSDHLTALTEELSSSRSKITHIFLTHEHGNHSNGLGHILSTSLISPDVVISSMLPRSALAGATLRRESFPSPISSRQLRDGEVLKLEDDRGQNSTTLKVIAAPGHTATSAAFYIPEEDSLFTGDAVSSSPLVNDTALTARPAHTAVEDVEAYSYTLSKLRNIMPKLIFPGHGELITNGFKHIDEAIDAIRDLDRRVLAILLERKGCSGEVIAKEIAKQCKADQNEELILQGTVRQVLLGLERRKLVKRKEVVKDPYAVSGGLDPTRIKGPGGLTMDQIFSKIQDSRRADWNSAAERKGGPQLSDAINLRRQQHPVHLKIPCSLDVAWETL